MTETKNVATYARIRPYNPAINEDKKLTACAQGDKKILNQNGDKQDTYKFTKVFDSDLKTDNIMVFNSAVKPLLDYKILQGINSIFMVYGQSGSGKSYTLIGEDGCLGVLPLALQYLLKHPEVQRIDMASIEAYGIQSTKVGLFDLVSQLSTKQNLKIKKPKKDQKQKPKKTTKQKQFDPYSSKDDPHLSASNAKLIEITETNCLEIITELQAVSHMAPTLKNPHSSRGHTVYFSRVKMKQLEDVYFMAVDLAGSEGQTALGTQTEFVQGLKLAMNKGKLKLNKKQMKGIEKMYNTRSLEAGCINNGLTQIQSIFRELKKKKISKSRGLGLRKVLSSKISLQSAYAILFTLSASANNNKITKATLNFAKQTQLIKVETKKAPKKINKDKIIQELHDVIEQLKAGKKQILISDDIKESKNDDDDTIAVKESVVKNLKRQISEAEIEEEKWTANVDGIDHTSFINQFQSKLVKSMEQYLSNIDTNNDEDAGRRDSIQWIETKANKFDKTDFMKEIESLIEKTGDEMCVTRKTIDDIESGKKYGPIHHTMDNSEITNLRQKIEVLEMENKDLKMENKELTMENKKLINMRLADCEQRLKSKDNDYQQLMTYSQTNSITHNKHIESTNKHIERAQEDISELKEDLNETKGNIDELKVSLNETNENINKLKENLETSITSLYRKMHNNLMEQNKMQNEVNEKIESLISKTSETLRQEIYEICSDDEYIELFYKTIAQKLTMMFFDAKVVISDYIKHEIVPKNKVMKGVKAVACITEKLAKDIPFVSTVIGLVRTVAEIGFDVLVLQKLARNGLGFEISIGGDGSKFAALFALNVTKKSVNKIEEIKKMNCDKKKKKIKQEIEGIASKYSADLIRIICTGYGEEIYKKCMKNDWYLDVLADFVIYRSVPTDLESIESSEVKELITEYVDEFGGDIIGVMNGVIIGAKEKWNEMGMDVVTEKLNQ